MAIKTPNIAPFDVDAQRFILAAGLTRYVDKRAINYLVQNLKSNGIWTKFNAIYPMVGGNAWSTKFNLVNPIDSDLAFRITWIANPSFSYNGVDFNGSTQYGKTQFNPKTTNNAASHLSYYSRENVNTATDQIDIGCGDGTTSFWLSCYYNASGLTSSCSRNNSNSVLLTGTNTSSAAFFVTSKTGTTAALYKNGASITSATDSAAVPNNTVYIGADNTSNVTFAPLFFTNRQCAFASIGLGLTAAQVFVFSQIVQQFQIILNRAV